MSNSNVTTLEAKPAKAPPATKELKPAVNGAKQEDFSGQKMQLTIAAGKGDGEREAVFVSHAGVPFQIPRGKPWIVPKEVVNVLENAQETTYTRDDKTGDIITTQSPRFTFAAVPVADEQPTGAPA